MRKRKLTFVALKDKPNFWFRDSFYAIKGDNDILECFITTDNNIPIPLSVDIQVEDLLTDPKNPIAKVGGSEIYETITSLELDEDTSELVYTDEGGVEKRIAISVGSYDYDVELSVDYPVVGAAEGESQKDFNEKIQDIIQALIGNIPPPTYVAPTLSINLANQTLEVGTNNTRTIQSTFIQNDAGAKISDKIIKNTIQVSSTNTYIETGVVVLGATTYRGETTYGQGPIKNNSIGIPDPTGRIQSGTVLSLNRVITGIIPFFWQTFDTLPDINSLDLSIFNKQVSTSSVTISIPMSVVGKHIVIIVPQDSAEKTKWHITDLNRGDIEVGGLFSPPQIKSLSSPSGYWNNENFRVYSTNYPTSVTPAIELRNN